MDRRKSHLPVVWSQSQWKTIVKDELDKFDSSKTRICIFLDNSTARIYWHLSKMGYEIYRVNTASHRLILPDGTVTRKRDLYGVWLPAADVLISGCTTYNRNGYTYTNYPRMVNEYGILSAVGLLSRKTARITLASSGQESNGIGNRSRMLFRADMILTPEKGAVRFSGKLSPKTVNAVSASAVQVAPANTAVVPAVAAV